MFVFLKTLTETLSKLIGLLKILSCRAGGSCWKVGAQFTFLSLTQSIFDGFSKIFFLLKTGLNCQFVKKWALNCAPCAPSAPSSYAPVSSLNKSSLHESPHSPSKEVSFMDDLICKSCAAYTTGTLPVTFVYLSFPIMGNFIVSSQDIQN